MASNDENSGPRPTVAEVLACQFSSWYPTFSDLAAAAAASSSLSIQSSKDEISSSTPDNNNKTAGSSSFTYPRKNVTIRSVIISHDDIPQESFRRFVLSDGVKLPTCATNLSSCATINIARRVEDMDDSSDDDEWESASNASNNKSNDEGDSHNGTEDDDDQTREQGEEVEEFEFPELTQRIKGSIKSLKGSVMPKLNWSSPKDATWINEGTMKCQTPGDVYLMIKSSDFCLHDVVGQTIQHCRDYEYLQQQQQQQIEKNDGDYPNSVQINNSLQPQIQLVLRKWCPNLHPSKEFRCFVRQHELIGISQRHHSQHYPHLIKDWQQIRDVIDDFYEDVVRLRYANGQIPNYVMDVYVDQKDRVWIVDFNPWSSTTDSLLFDWTTELMTMDLCDGDGTHDGIEDSNGDTMGRGDGLPIMKIVETSRQVRQDPLSSYRAPIDAVQLASMTHGDSKKFEEFMKMCQQQTEESE